MLRYVVEKNKKEKKFTLFSDHDGASKGSSPELCYVVIVYCVLHYMLR